MLFNSIHFLFFFPIVTLFYFIFPHKIRWIWLLFTSYYFYMAWNPKYALLLAIVTIITYISGLLIDRSDSIQSEKKRVFQRKLWVILSLISNLAILFFFKYFHFAIFNINRLLSYLGMQLIQPEFDVLLPLGISFYTFKAISYTLDVYRGEHAEKNFAKYALYIAFFPQLLAGPIDRSKIMLTQINERHYFDYDRIKNGLLLILWGFFQKMIIADRASILVNVVFENSHEYAGFQIMVAVLLYSVQIYCDFSAYSNIAKGAAQIMGFHLMDNFRQPYLTTSIKDFWQRWHISLSTWFRDYLYIPLGGNRCARLRKYFNIMITFLASGLWHGASWNYIAWGGLHGAYQIASDFANPYKYRLYNKIHIKTASFSFKLGKTLTNFALISFAWIFFRASGLRDALRIIGRLFSAFNPYVFFDKSLYYMGLSVEDIIILIISIFILFIVDMISTRYNIIDSLSNQNFIFRWLIYILLTMSILLFMNYGTGYQVQTQFIYFQF